MDGFSKSLEGEATCEPYLQVKVKQAESRPEMGGGPEQTPLFLVQIFLSYASENQKRCGILFLSGTKGSRDQWQIRDLGFNLA